jgi:hypothetical protein
MNPDLLQKTIDSYMEKFEVQNSPEHREIYKWAAVSNFQKYWDIDAPDFGKMFKRALSESEDLVDDDLTKPSAGIEYLCAKDEETEEKVRDSFRDLLEPDQSDYRKRQKKCEAFVEKMNHMLEEAGDDEWSHRQSMRAAIMYLAFIEPDDNFMYREAEEKAFAHYVKYTGKVGSGKSFSLKSYYTMCEEIVSAISENEDLLTMVQNELEREADRTEDSSVTDIDGENHILAFDLIYCTQNYGFYDEQVVTPHKSGRGALQAEERERKIAALRKKKEAIETELSAALEKIEANPLCDLKGLRVHHAKFGDGAVTGQEDKRILVSFGAGEKKFVVPDAVIRGFLRMDDAGAVDSMKKYGMLDEEIARLKRDLRVTEIEISELG